MKTTDLGRLGEVKVSARLVELGWYPFIDPSGKCPVDLLAWKGGLIISFQVKSCGSPDSDGRYMVQVGSLRPNRTETVVHKFNKDSCDYLAVYLLDDDEVCFIPSEEVPGRALSIGGEKRKIEDYVGLAVSVKETKQP